VRNGKPALSRTKDRSAAAAVRMRVPSWMTGGDPQQLERLCDWDMQIEDGQVGTYLVRTRGARHGRSAKLLVMTKLADARNAGNLGSYSRMNRLRPLERMVPEESWGAALSVYERLEEKYPDEPAATLLQMQVLITAAPTIETAVNAAHQTFSNWVLPSEPKASCHLIEVSEALGYRYSVTRALLNVHEPAQIKSADEAQKLLFGSAQKLLSDVTLGLDAYLDCMCSSLSPDVWAFPIPRPGGIVLVIFGRVAPGQSSIPLDKIQLLAPSMDNPPHYRPDPAITSDDLVKGAQWWIQQLNVMFSIATEPGNHIVDGIYHPSMALEKLLTLEQVFRDCQSIATSTRDQHARLTLAFQALLRIRGLVPSLAWKKVFGFSAARKTLRTIKSEMPANLHPLYLPRAERAIAALEEMEQGFFLANRAGEEKVRLPNDNNGKDELVTRSQAVTDWLLLYRNSLHGFDQPTTPRQQALLAAHDGHIPGAVADLAWLQLLGLLAKPEALARYRSSSRTERPPVAAGAARR
jgi:hypothetical protein